MKRNLPATSWVSLRCKWRYLRSRTSLLQRATSIWSIGTWMRRRVMSSSRAKTPTISCAQRQPTWPRWYLNYLWEFLYLMASCTRWRRMAIFTCMTSWGSCRNGWILKSAELSHVLLTEEGSSALAVTELCEYLTPRRLSIYLPWASHHL